MRQRVGERGAGDVDAQDLRRDALHQLGGEAERLGVERRVALGLGAQRVQAGGEVAVRAVGLDQRVGGLDGLQELLVGGAAAAAPGRLGGAAGAATAAAGPAGGTARRAARAEVGEDALVEPVLALRGSASTSCRKRPDSAPWMIRWS